MTEEIQTEPPKPEFIPGDIVVLKSGSPKMTVLACTEKDARVIWCPFETKEITYSHIPLIALKKIA